MAGVLLLFGAAAPVLAAPTGVTASVHQGDTEVSPPDGIVEGCTIHLHFVAEEAQAGDWAIRADTEHGLDVLTGSFDTAGGDDRVPDDGTLAITSGHYVLVWDAESPIDNSFDVLPFDVVCEGPTESDGGDPSPSGEELPISSDGEESPDGSVLGIAGTPRPTLPNTDTNAISSTNSSDLRPALGLMGLLALGSLFVASRRRRPGSRHS
jgi:MYXO-CTERM domain-containing protein